MLDWKKWIHSSTALSRLCSWAQLMNIVQWVITNLPFFSAFQAYNINIGIVSFCE